MKFSRIITARIDFQSVAFSPSSKQMDSRANFTTEGGFAIVLTSTSCCLRIDFTAIYILDLSIDFRFSVIDFVCIKGIDCKCKRYKRDIERDECVVSLVWIIDIVIHVYTLKFGPYPYIN